MVVLKYTFEQSYTGSLIISLFASEKLELSQYDALIFDCDGTLTHSMHLHYVAWRDTVAKYGIVFKEKDFYDMAGMPSDKVIQKLATEQKVELDDHKSILVQKEDCFLQNISQLEPFPFTVDIARANHGLKPMAVASGGDFPVVTAQLNHLGIIELFDTIVTAEHTKNHKPHPDVFLEAARRVDTVPEKCLVFEDGDLGIEAAKRANMDFVDVRKHFH